MHYYEQTRTADTTKEYLARATQLLRQIPEHYMGEHGAGFHPVEIATWLEDAAPGLRKSTFRQYKAALVCYMERMATQNTEAAEDYAAGISRLKALSSNLAAPRTSLPKRTSSGKVKLIRLDDLPTLCHAMIPTQDAQWKPRACLWLIAGMATGLRPIEWKTAELVDQTADGGFTIRVENAKNTNGRASGDTREIPVEPGWMAEYAQKHMRNVSEWLESGNDFADYYRTCKDTLNREVRKLWPKAPSRHYSLYSGRHQFCANLKMAGYTQDEIALLMGHASTETAKEHYGKRRSGHGGLTPKANVPSLSKIPVFANNSPIKR